MNFIRTTFSPVSQMIAATAIFALVLSLVYGAFPVAFAGNNGAIWTTTGSCGTPQNANQYEIGDQIFINGSGFDAGDYDWDISGQPGGASADPGDVVADGVVTIDETGAFCFSAYEVAEDDDGEYSVKVGNKGDNYSVEGESDESDDMCPNINGKQKTIPEGLIIDEEGNCVEEPEDLCPNIPDIQTEIPQGMIINEAGECVTPVVDVCPNIDGDQATVPDGKYIDQAGNCVPIVQQNDKGFIKVWKHVVGTTVTDYSTFSFKISGLNDGNSYTFPANQNYLVIPNVPVGSTYTVTEDAEAGYLASYAEAIYNNTVLPDGECTDLSVTAGQYTYCRITNTVDVCPNIPGAQSSQNDCPIDEDDTTITVKKVVEEGSNEETEFDFMLDASLTPFASLAHGETSAPQVVTPGEHIITEIGEADWTLEGVQCATNGGAFTPVAYPEGIVTLELAEGDDVVCEFMNEEDEGEDPDPKVCRIGENLLSNGSFETPTAPTNGWGIFNPVTGWSISNDGLELWNTFNGSGIGLASEGFQNAELDGNSPSTITQPVVTVPGVVYQLRFDFSPRAGTGLLTNALEARADGAVVATATGDGSANGGNVWTTYSGTFTATDASTDIAFIDMGTADSLGTLLDNVILCETDEEPETPTYSIDGYKWNDLNGDGIWQKDGEGAEPTLPGWVIRATSGDLILSTTTDATGYYYFEVGAGSWTVNEVQQDGWNQTAPTDPNTCSATFGGDTEVQIADLECDFGNERDDSDPEDPRLACTINASQNQVEEGDDVTIFWTSDLADSVTLNGNSVVLDGSQLFENLESDTTYTLIATDNFGEGEGSANVECEVTVEVDEDNGGGGSSSGSRKRSSSSDNDPEEPIGEVLGEATSVLPLGAPDTGAGGTSPSPFASLIALFGMIASVLGLRATKNG